MTMRSTAWGSLIIRPVVLTIVAFTLSGASTAAAAKDAVDARVAGLHDQISIVAIDITGEYTVKPAALDFGERPLGTSTTQRFWLANHSGAALPIDSIFLRGTAKSQYRVAHSCGTAVAVDAGCAIRVTFAPASPGEKLANLKVVAVVAGQNVIRTRPLSGTGVATATVTWTDWSNITAGNAVGDMGGVTVRVTATAGVVDGPSQTNCGFDYWREPDASQPAYTGGTVSNRPKACEQVALTSPVTLTVTFSSAVTGLYMALLSIGDRTTTVTYDFDRSFAVDSNGVGFWSSTNDGNPGRYSLLTGDRIAMNEVHGVLAFDGPVTSLTFTTSPAEFWHAFTFGRANSASAPTDE